MKGALGSWGAAMIEPYADNPDTRGLEVTPREVLRDFIARFHQDVSEEPSSLCGSCSPYGCRR